MNRHDLYRRNDDNEDRNVLQQELPHEAGVFFIKAKLNFLVRLKRFVGCLHRQQNQ